jgi:hypothetical protein
MGDIISPELLENHIKWIFGWKNGTEIVDWTRGIKNGASTSEEINLDIRNDEAEDGWIL